MAGAGLEQGKPLGRTVMGHAVAPPQAGTADKLLIRPPRGTKPAPAAAAGQITLNAPQTSGGGSFVRVTAAAVTTATAWPRGAAAAYPPLLQRGPAPPLPVSNRNCDRQSRRSGNLPRWRRALPAQPAGRRAAGARRRPAGRDPRAG